MTAHTPVIVHAPSDFEHDVVQAVQACRPGVRVERVSSLSGLVELLRMGASPDLVLLVPAPDAGAYPSAARRLQTLTPQQHKVLALVAQGHSNKVAARLMGLSESTVKAHLTVVLDKLGVRSRTQAAMAYGNTHATFVQL